MIQRRWVAFLLSTGLLFGFACPNSDAAAPKQKLKRRAYLGLAVKELPEERRLSLKLPPDQGVLVLKVFPLSSASDAGIVEGDVVLKLNGVSISTPSQLIRTVKACQTGSRLQIDTLRGGKRRKKSALLKAFPEETSPDFDIIYEEVQVNDTARRTIITRPKSTGRFPAVLFVGGIGCYSVDYPLDDSSPYKRLIYGIAQQNFVTMRLEKSGMGDSAGPPCSTVDFNAEIASYEEALKSLSQLDFVDPNKLIVIGHSIGGIVAPVLASKKNPQLSALVVADTVGNSWFEYELSTARNQKLLEDSPAKEIDRYMKEKELCLHCLLVERRSPDSIIKEHPFCSNYLKYPASLTYMQQVGNLNLPQIWESVACPVLVIYGSSDFVTDQKEHEFICNTVNKIHPGKAKLSVIPGMDHYLTRAENQRESFNNKKAGKSEEFATEIVPLVSSWLLGTLQIR